MVSTPQCTCLTMTILIKNKIIDELLIKLFNGTLCTLDNSCIIILIFHFESCNT